MMLCVDVEPAQYEWPRYHSKSGNHLPGCSQLYPSKILKVCLLLCSYLGAGTSSTRSGERGITGIIIQQARPFNIPIAIP